MGRSYAIADSASSPSNSGGSAAADPTRGGAPARTTADRPPRARRRLGTAHPQRRQPQIEVREGMLDGLEAAALLRLAEFAPAPVERRVRALELRRRPQSAPHAGRSAGAPSSIARAPSLPVSAISSVGLARAARRAALFARQLGLAALARRDAAAPSSGTRAHAGRARVHTVAPRSMMACVYAATPLPRACTPPPAAHSAASTSAAPGSPSMPNTRASTRFTLPSRIAMPLAARQRQDRAGGRAPDAGQRHHRLEARREIPAVLLTAPSRAGLQVARPRVIAQARPQMQHLVLRRRGERLEVGKARHEALEIRDHGGHLGLLQHHLGHPHPIRGGVALPRQLLRPCRSNQRNNRRRTRPDPPPWVSQRPARSLANNPCSLSFKSSGSFCRSWSLANPSMSSFTGRLGRGAADAPGCWRGSGRRRRPGWRG